MRGVKLALAGCTPKRLLERPGVLRCKGCRNARCHLRIEPEIKNLTPPGGIGNNKPTIATTLNGFRFALQTKGRSLLLDHFQPGSLKELEKACRR